MVQRKYLLSSLMLLSAIGTLCVQAASTGSTTPTPPPTLIATGVTTLTGGFYSGQLMLTKMQQDLHKAMQSAKNPKSPIMTAYTSSMSSEKAAVQQRLVTERIDTLDKILSASVDPLIQTGLFPIRDSTIMQRPISIQLDSMTNDLCPKNAYIDHCIAMTSSLDYTLKGIIQSTYSRMPLIYRPINHELNTLNSIADVLIMRKSSHYQFIADDVASAIMETMSNPDDTSYSGPLKKSINLTVQPMIDTLTVFFDAKRARAKFSNADAEELKNIVIGHISILKKELAKKIPNTPAAQSELSRVLTKKQKHILSNIEQSMLNMPPPGAGACGTRSITCANGLQGTYQGPSCQLVCPTK